MLILDACNAGDQDQLRELIQAGVDVNVRDEDGNTVLVIASFKGFPSSIIHLIIEAGADVNAVNVYHCNALHKAAVRGHLEVCQVLVERGCNINIQNKGGSTPLIWAAESGHVDIVSHLLKSGADPEIRKQTGETCLLAAVNQGHVPIVRILLAHNADIGAVDQFGKGVMELARSDEIRGVLGAVSTSKTLLIRRFGDEIYEEVTLVAPTMQCLFETASMALKGEVSLITRGENIRVALRNDEQVMRLCDGDCLDAEIL